MFRLDSMATPPTLLIPTIQSAPDDIDVLCTIWHAIHETPGPIQLDFHQCQFLTPTAIAFLGAVARRFQQDPHVQINWTSFVPSVHEYLTRNGLLAAFGHGERGHVSHAVPFREDQPTGHHADLMTYLQHSWLGGPWIKLSPTLRDAIISRVLEGYLNVWEHSISPVGAITCGQHFPRLKQLSLTILDLGIGIPTSVRNFLKQPSLSDLDAIRWALQRGNSTGVRGTARGLGLDLLHQFVRHNHGSLEIYSYHAHVTINEHGATYAHRSSSFPGTLLQFTLQCDETSYDFSNLQRC